MINDFKKSSILSFIPFALPDIGEEEISAVVNCMRSGWITTGPMCSNSKKHFPITW